MSNVWAKFDKLLPKRKYLIGQVLSLMAAETVEIRLLSGEIIRVGGSGVSVDDYVIVENGYIQRTVPGLTPHNITIY